MKPIQERFLVKKIDEHGSERWLEEGGSFSHLRHGAQKFETHFLANYAIDQMLICDVWDTEYYQIESIFINIIQPK